MSDFLDRLVARARGAGPLAVPSRGPAPSAAGWAVEDHVVSRPAAVPTQAAPQPHQRPEPAGGVPAQPAVRSSQVPSEPAATHVEVERRIETREVRRVATPENPPPLTAASNQTVAPGVPQPNISDRATRAPAELEQPASAPVTAEPTAAAPSPATERTVAPDHSLAPDPVVDCPSPLVPALPATPRVSAAPLPAPPPPLPAVTTPREPTTPDVHVHIERVDIRGVDAPPVVTPDHAAAPAPEPARVLSLGEYLLGRTVGGTP